MSVLTESTTTLKMSRLPDDDLRMLLLIRHFENTLLRLFGQNMLHGTTHTSLGQEYIPVSLRSLVVSEDFVFSNHRGHGHYLARHEDPAGLLAEIMARQGAVCGGVGGSQHLRRDRYLSTGVQGQSVPVAAGVALHLKMHENGRLACVYIGDGTWGEGAVYEALNIAALWSLPLLVVVENNGIAQSTPTAQQLAGSIEGRARAFGIRYLYTQSIDVLQIREQIEPLVVEVRAGHGPAILEFRTHRVGPHSKGDDTRSLADRELAQAGDWYRRYAAEHPEHFHDWDALIRDEVNVIAREVARASLADSWNPTCE
jgi:acetoin:2,6-dichlorophenolindophenol oxidoreductase subunit alpha